jgi:cyclopropane fatty-acyl-phospholipid synthase-like methyltransferase
MARLRKKDELLIKSLPEIYNEFAMTYEANRGLFDMSELMNDFYQRLPFPRGHLLDLGCGTGEPFSKFFIDKGWEVTGVDFSAKMLELAAKYVPKMRTIFSNMSEVAFPEQHFQAIIAIYSLFHLPQDKHFDMFANMHKWLIPGGKILFAYATKEYTGFDEFEGCKEFMGKQLFYSHKKPEVMLNDLQKIGFKIEKIEYKNIGNEVFIWVMAKKANGI